MRVFLAILVLMVTAAAQASEPAGQVARLRGDASSDGRTLAAGSPVTAGEVLHTGPQARLEVDFIDGTRLTLGENATLAVDSFVYDPAAARGDVLLNLKQGAVLLVTGLVGKLPQRPFKLVSPVATIGIRGTTFWSGSLDNPLDALVVDGAISVSTQGGTVILEKGQGTGVTAAGAPPGPAVTWAQAKIDRALAQTAF